MIGASRHALLTPLEGLEGFKRVVDLVNKNRPSTTWVNGAVDAQKWHIAAGILWETKRPSLIIAPNELRAKEIYENLYFFFKEACRAYPSRDLLFYAADVKSSDITRRRLVVLDRLEKYSRSEVAKFGVAPPVVVLSAEALLDRMTPPETFHRYRLKLSNGDARILEDIARRLVQMGYERAGLVEGPGQFALRGGILDIYPTIGMFMPIKGKTYLNHSTSYSGLDENKRDIFPFSEGQALRIEFLGDEVDSIRLIDTHSQRSVENIAGFEVYPARELVFSRARLRRAVDFIKA